MPSIPSKAAKSIFYCKNIKYASSVSSNSVLPTVIFSRGKKI